MRIIVLGSYVVITCCVAIFAIVQFYQSLYRASAEAHLESLTRHVNSPAQEAMTLLLSEKLQNFTVPLAYDLSLASVLEQWSAYNSQGEQNTDSHIILREKSAQLRPTWSANHVERSKYYRGLDAQKEQELLMLAQFFGPHTKPTNLRMLDHMFSNWEQYDRHSKIKASTTLLSMCCKGRDIEPLNQMIKYSQGKQRMCGLLSFNDMSIDACL